MTNISIRNKQMSLISMVLLVVLAYSIKIADESYSLYINSNKTYTIVELSLKVSSVLHEMQKERGASVGYLGSKDGKFKDILLSQQIKTDNKIKELKEFCARYSTSEVIMVKNIDFNSIEKIRKKINLNSVDIQTTIDFYTLLNKNIIDLILYFSTISKDVEVRTAFNSFILFISSKEKAGLERAILSSVFLEDKFTINSFAKFTSLVSEQKTLLNLFSNIASDKIKLEFKHLQSDSSFKEVQRIRKIALSKNKNFGIDSIYWFATITKKIEKLKEFEDKIALKTIYIANNKSNIAMRTMIILSFVTITILLLTIYLSYYVTRGITRAYAEIEANLLIMDENIILTKTDLKGIITHASRAFIKISGYSENELIGKPHNILRHPDMPKSVFKDLWDTVKSDEVWRGEVKNLKKDGSFYWVKAKVEPDYDIDGNHIGYSSLRIDITSKKAVEELSENLEKKVKEQTKDLKKQFEEIEEVHRHTRESIEYAALIQTVLMPDNDKFKKYFNDYFTIWNPKDVVGGDIYLFEELRDDNECLLMVIDCTGHGVPGAFVTMLVKAIERQIVSRIKYSDEVVSPAKLLNVFNKSMKHLLKQDNVNSISNAGFDGQIMYFNKKENIIKIASARNEIFYYQDDELHVIKGDRHSIGYKDSNSDYQFTEHTIDTSKETTLYLSTDGYWDQNGGEKKLPYGKKRLKRFLNGIYKKSMAEQQKEFLNTFESYRDGFENNDDVTIIGLKI